MHIVEVSVSAYMIEWNSCQLCELLPQFILFALVPTDTTDIVPSATMVIENFTTEGTGE